MKKHKGVVVVFTGDGKGKTTAALGVALRASGYGMQTLMVQFMKGQVRSGEENVCPAGLKSIEIHPFGAGYFWKGDDRKPHVEAVQEGWLFMKDRLKKKKYDILILDELNVAVDKRFLPLAEVTDFLRRRDSSLHVIITGRNARARLISMADIVTEMKEMKHIYKKGVPAIEGLDY